MKNFKKVLALVLAVATLMSFATIASALTTSASYKDAAAIEKNGQTEAVDVLSAIGVLTGYPDTNFKPDQDITRAEAAKIIAMFDNGSVDISSLYTSANPFTDVKGNWAESYVAYGYKAGIIAGVGKLLFAPNAKLTGVQFLKMVLVVLGYDAKTEGLEGTSWAVNTLALAKKIGLLNGLSKLDVAANLTRGQAAQIMLNALDTYTVEYGQQYKNNGQYYYIDAAGNRVYVTNPNVGSEPTKFGGNYLDGFYTINFTSVDGVVVAHIARVDADATDTNYNTKENTIYTITNHSFNSDKTAATITVAGNDQSLNVTADTKVYIVSGQAITTGKVSDITDTTVGTVAPNVGKIYNAARIVMSTTGTNNVAELYIMSDVYTSAAAGTFDTWTK